MPAFALAALGVLAFEIATRVVSLPPSLFDAPPATTTLVDVRGRTLACLPSKTARAQHPIALTEMGDMLPRVIVALEDHRFYQHSGVDLRATAAAFFGNLRKRRIVFGGSTITQQLIKLASGRTGRSWRAKVYENLAAVHLERLWSKDRILQEYLNRSHYANRQFGPAAAAAAYFHKKPANLTPPEAIYLAGLPQAPTRFNPWRHPDAAAARYRRSLARLAMIGFPAPAQMAGGLELPRVAAFEPPRRLAPHFVDTIRKTPTQFRGGVVRTTLDLDLQHFAEKTLQVHLARLASRHVNEGAIVILDTRTGAVCAMVGSHDYAAPRSGQINGTTSHRSSGSTLKPFLYLRGIDQRQVTAATLLPDTPDAVRAEYIDYDPVNYDKRFWGPVRLREALANSLNVPAVVTLSRVGARNTFLALEDYGFNFARPFSEYGAGLILGNAEIRLLDLTAAFTVFAGEGLAVEPRLLAAAPVRHRFLAAPEAVAIVADILADNGARQKTFGPFSPLAFENHRIPCKSGTSSGFRDAWTVGVTRQHAVGVWMGNFDGRQMEEIAAASGPAPLWHDIVEHLLARGDSSVPPPAPNSRLIQRDVCSLTGFSPCTASPGAIQEWFLAGTEPSEDAARFFHTIGGVTRFVLPANYALWCASRQNYLRAGIAADARLRIVSPAPRATFLIDPHLPRAQQALQLVSSGDPADALNWTVDGESVVPSSGRYFWPLREGTHIVEAESSLGRATTEFTVE
jgi:penicillin-binding protein 1C